MRVGINGLGRIGRGLLKALWGHPSVEVAALNDLADAATLAHLLAHDTYYGPWPASIVPRGEGIEIDGRLLPLSHGDHPSAIPRSEAGVDCAVEATGRFKDRASLEGHGIPVLLSASSREADRQIVFGVNHESLEGGERILSATSCTTHCIAPPVCALADAFSIEAVLFNTVHCYNVSQTLVDAPRRDLRRSRAGALNMIPTTTSASIALEDVLPGLQGRIQGMAIRVPAPAVSLTEITLQVAERPTREDVRDCLEKAARGPLVGIMRLEEEELVSMDFVGEPASSVVDVPLIQTQGPLIRIIVWYDNERGYIRRLVDLLEFLEGKGFWHGTNGREEAG